MVSSSGSPPPYDLGDDVCVRQVISIRHRVPGVTRAPRPAGRPGAGFEGRGRGRENETNGSDLPHDAGSIKTVVFRAPDAVCCGDGDIGTHRGRVGLGLPPRWPGAVTCRFGGIVARNSLPMRAVDRVNNGCRPVWLPGTLLALSLHRIGSCPGCQARIGRKPSLGSPEPPGLHRPRGAGFQGRGRGSENSFVATTPPDSIGDVETVFSRAPEAVVWAETGGLGTHQDRLLGRILCIGSRRHGARTGPTRALRCRRSRIMGLGCALRTILRALGPAATPLGRLLVCD